MGDTSYIAVERFSKVEVRKYSYIYGITAYILLIESLTLLYIEVKHAVAALWNDSLKPN